MAKAPIKTASVLAFERKLANSDALMFAGNWQDRHEKNNWQEIAIQSKDVRGTISNRLKAALANDPLKLDAEIQKANLQRVDIAALPFDCDTLKILFSLRVLGDLQLPSACNNADYQALLSDKIVSYIKEHQFKELSKRYAENLANGRFLWRNRVGAEAVEVKITCSAKQQDKEELKWCFDAHQFSLRQFSQDNAALAELSELIRQGLLGNQPVFLQIEAFVRLGIGQEIFPSQELVLDSSSSKEGRKSKFLYQVGGVAAMHSQKIGNALRTIDTWYPKVDELGPIAVEPYGAVTNRGTAYRQPKEKMDFYHLLDNWVLKDQIPPVEQQHYVIATLIRGGVFGESN